MIDGLHLLDAHGVPTTLDRITQRAAEWHRKHDAPAIDWEAFYRARATFEPTRKRSHAARAGHGAR